MHLLTFLTGREYRATFICTSEPVNSSFIPLEKTKSLCDPAVFNTVITRALSMIVAVGNPFRLLKIENENYVKKNGLESCWFSYMRHCWEIKSLTFSNQDKVAKDWDSFSEIEAKIVDSMERSLKQSTTTDLDNDSILSAYHDVFASHHTSYKLGLGDVAGDQSWTVNSSESPPQKKQSRKSNCSGVVCYLRQISRGHCLAIPIINSGPFSIIDQSQRRGAFDGAKVLVQEDQEKSNPILHKTVGHISEILDKGSMLPVICEVDVDNPHLFIPIDGISPKLANLPRLSKYFLEREIDHIKVALEKPQTKSVICYDLSSIKNGLPKISNTLSVEFAKDLLFVVRPLAWNPSEPYPEGAVIGMIPRGTSFGNAKRILYTQYQVERSPINLELGTAEVVHTPDYSDAIAICMSSEHDTANYAFSLSDNRDNYEVQVHIPNVASVLSRTSEFNEAKFKHWYSFSVVSSFYNDANYYPVLSTEMIKKLSFSKDKTQNTITFVVTFSKSDKKPSSMRFLQARVRCCKRYTLKEAEEDYKENILETLLDLARNWQPNDQFLCKVPKDISECPLVGGMVNTFLTFANMQAAESISLNMPKNILLNVQPSPESYNERFQELIKDFSKVYNIGSDFAWLLEKLVNQPKRSLFPKSGPLIRFDILGKVIKLLEEPNLEQAETILKAYDSYPEFIALLDAFEAVIQEEEFTCASKDETQW